MKRTRWFVAGLVAVAAGCGVDSEYVITSGIWAHFHIEHRINDEVVAMAELSVDQGIDANPLHLSGGDVLDCNGVRLRWAFDIINVSIYNVVVPVAADGSYLFTLTRPDEAITTEVQTSAVPVITGFLPSDALSAGDDLTVQWDASAPGSSVNVWADGTCLATRSDLSVPDDGEHTFAALAARPDVVDPCAVDATVVRNGRGSVDPAFLGGYTSSTIADEVAGPMFTP